MATQQKLRRFYRSNLPTIVWDPKHNRALCEFVDGQFYTEDPEVASILTDKGYPEVALDQTTPPDIMFPKGQSLEGNVPIMGKGITEEVMLEREKRTAEQKRLAAKAAEKPSLEDNAKAIAQEVVSKSPAELALDKAQAERKLKAKPKVRKPTAKKMHPKKAPAKPKARRIARRKKE